MAKILVLYYSMYGHIETMANAVAEGARRVPGAEVDILRVPETMEADRFAQVGGKTDQQAAEATPEVLPHYDAIIVGTPTRFGNMAGQMRTFWDRTGGLWASGALFGKVASVFTSTGTGGGQEQTITSVWTTLAHHGMVIVPIGYGTERVVRYFTGSRWNALWSHHPCGRRWFASAYRSGTEYRPFSGRTCCRTDRQTAGLI